VYKREQKQKKSKGKLGAYVDSSASSSSAEEAAIITEAGTEEPPLALSVSYEEDEE